ncbi:hypothetical protein, partial [Microvirga tunisiensis]|uniref:hypothetical protein n=1 Tax=Microvirga tunisiensis TaxID=2108360 RepID=UPI001AEE7B7B
GLAIARNMLPAWIADCFPEVVPWPALPAASGRSFNWLYIAFDPKLTDPKLTDPKLTFVGLLSVSGCASSPLTMTGKIAFQVAQRRRRHSAR